jgi:hypothetical protein
MSMLFLAEMLLLKLTPQPSFSCTTVVVHSYVDANNPFAKYGVLQLDPSGETVRTII